MRWVVKLGGSLYASKYLQKWLDILSNHTTNNLIIVPGGGPFADLVRQVDEKYLLNEKNSHAMAVLAMQQFAHLIQSISPGLALADSMTDIIKQWERANVVVWEPYLMVRDECPLKETWEVSSDSLAAWLAVYMSADRLTYIKSTEIVLHEKELPALIDKGCVDTGLQNILRNTGITVDFEHKSSYEEFSQQIL